MSQIKLTDLLGKRFADHGRGPDKFDCYGLAAEVFKRYGVNLPDYKISCKNASKIDSTIEKERSNWKRLDKPENPSLVVMRFNSNLYNHVGVYIGNGQFIHTARKTGVRIESVESIYWKNRIEGYYVPR